MPAKRKEAGKAGKGKAKKAKRAAPRDVPATSYLMPYRGLPVELITRVFKNIEDPVTATTFSLVDKLFHNIFHTFRNEIFPNTTPPLKLAFIFRFDDQAKSQISLRATLNSWFPTDLFFDVSRGKYVHIDYAQDLLEEIMGAVEQSRDERKEALYKRREAKERRQEERAERKAEKAAEMEDIDVMYDSSRPH